MRDERRDVQESQLTLAEELIRNRVLPAPRVMRLRTVHEQSLCRQRRLRKGGQGHFSWRDTPLRSSRVPTSQAVQIEHRMSSLNLDPRLGASVLARRG